MTDSNTINPCVIFLKKLSDEIGLQFHVEYPVSKKKPTIILSWIGTRPELKSIFLNSHMDVVPVFEEFWTHDPFAADIDDEGRIFARGSQDMKCCGMQYLGVIRSFIRNNIKLKRTLHVVFVPDEEIFGPEGMPAFVRTETFNRLNVGCVLDEGIASPNDTYTLFYAERRCWHVLFRVCGQPGHGSLLLEDTAAEKVRLLLDKIYDYRASQEKLLSENPSLLLGDVTSINVTNIKGGKQRNVLPPFIEVTVDIRMAITVDSDKFEEMLNQWVKDCSGNIEIEFHVKEPYCVPTKTDDSNIYWKAFKSAIDELNIKVLPQVFPAGTDSSYLRALGLPAFGFSPMINTPILLHDHDEYLSADVYLEGIEIYKKIIQNIGNTED